MSYRYRIVQNQTSSESLPRDARRLNKQCGSGFMISSGQAVKNSTQSSPKSLAFQSLTCLSKGMRKTYNHVEAECCTKIPATYGESNATMTNKVNEQLSITTDFSDLQITVLKNGIEIDWRNCSGLSLSEYNLLFSTLVILHTQGKTEVRNG